MGNFPTACRGTRLGVEVIIIIGRRIRIRIILLIIIRRRILIIIIIIMIIIIITIPLLKGDTPVILG